MDGREVYLFSFRGKRSFLLLSLDQEKVGESRQVFYARREKSRAETDSNKSSDLARFQSGTYRRSLKACNKCRPFYNVTLCKECELMSSLRGHLGRVDKGPYF